MAKVPKQADAEVKAAFWSIFDDIDEPPGERAVAEATALSHGASAFPSPALEADASLQLHRGTFGESCRRVKVIGRLPGETSCLSLLWAGLDRASRGWRVVTQTSETVRQLQDVRRQLVEPPVDLGARRKARTTTTTDGEALSA